MPKSDNLIRAHSLLKESKAACSISDLDTVIGLLSQAAHAILPSHPNLPECLDHFAAVLIARFSITQDLNDVRKAIGFRCGALGGDIRDLIEPNIIESNPDSPAPQELLSSAYQLLSQFRRSLDAPKISTAIFFYEKVKAKQDITHPDRWNTQRALAEALLTRYRATGKKKDLHDGTMLLREQHLFESGYLATLCAAILMQPGLRPVEEVALLLEAAGPDDPVARSLAWEGLSHFLLANHVPKATCRHHSPREEEDEAVDDGVIVPSNMVQKLTGNRNQNLGNMALELEGQFKEHGQIRFLDEAIKLRRNALQSASRRARDLHLDSLATTLQTRFEAVGDQKDIDEAVDLHRKALSIRVGTHHKRDISLLNLVNALLSRFDRLGNRKDIDEAIELLRKLVDMQPSPHLNRLGCLNNLAIALQTRFDNFGVVKDMMEAIQMFRDVLAIHSLPDSDRADSLSNLASALRTRSEQSGDVEDMKEAVALHREALSITPVGHPDRGHALNKLASSILDQFRISGDSADIGESVKLHRKALALYSPDDPGYGSALDDLANALWTRYFQGNNPHDINESVDLHRQSLALYPHSHTSRGGQLHNLAVCLQTRYENLGDPHDMTEAIELHREALLLHAVPHPDRPKSLTNLANALKTRFDATGNQNDIDESIRLIRLYRESEKVEASASNGLANAILSRFEQWHDPQDIVEIIQIYRDSLARCPDPNPDHGSCLNRLANALCTSFHHGGDTRHLDEAITLHREAIAAYSPSHTNHGSALNDLAVALRTRFHRLHDFDDIEKVIELHRTALALRPIPHPARATSLSNLANALFDLHGDLEDIEEAISLHREALELHPAPYADRARWLNNLAHCLESAYIHHNDERYLQQSMATFKEAATYSSAPPITRFNYATYWANIATKRPQTQTSALEAYQIAINILPQLAALSLDVRSRHQILTTIASSAIGAGAANCAISLGNPGLAVEFLEASRSVFWTQALRLRTPLDDLRAINPKLASEFTQLSQDLEQASFRNNKLNNTGDVALLEAEGERCRHLNEQWERIVDSIRSINNFKDFMRPQGIATLQTAARLGPIVIIALGESVAHTLVVKANETQSVTLPLLTRERATYLVDLTRAVTSRADSHFDLKQFNASCGDGGREAHRLFGTKEVLDSRPREDIFLDLLGALWNEIASPVISALELKKSTNPQRLWWCLTGPLIFLPIHAAGINLNNELEDCVSNYVISSYTPTLTTLLNPPREPLESFKMTTVIVPDAPNSSYLAGARTELAEIKRRVPEEWHTVVGETSMATVEATITALGDCSIAHFACHGVQDTVNPLNSGLVLSDGRLGITELMRRASVKDSNLSLAFLSACETAKGDTSTPDEAMHFAGVMLFAGFRSVIGTMWPMDDRDGPKVAATFYERLFGRFDATLQPRKFPDLAKSAEALHHAVNKLKEGKDVHLRWVPFVHYGL
ncbi:CHAT domain-containing protein [Mycena pura]|uniref:CHAT domain-containing protein n=1 Tax=Mycena pura TaxID=153505 RepID=A0AAD6V3S2_9AGAR|nr:CHAT domain-containing protein [Mycena pura]